MKRRAITTPGLVPSAPRWLILGLLAAFTIWASGGVLMLHTALAHPDESPAGATVGHASDHAAAPADDSDRGPEHDCPVCYLLVHAVGLAAATGDTARYAQAPVDHILPIVERVTYSRGLTTAAPRGPPAHA